MRIYRRYYRIVSRGESTPEHCQALLWDILWLLTENQEGGSEETNDLLATSAEWHPAVRKALNRIEQRLSETLTISDLAKEAGVSYSYLARLFQRALGKSVVGHIRHRRVERATHLLRHSTLPIKAIAAAVGIPDLHLFNKVIHQAVGCSPRAFRQANCRK